MEIVVGTDMSGLGRWFEEALFKGRGTAPGLRKLLETTLHPDSGQRKSITYRSSRRDYGGEKRP